MNLDTLVSFMTGGQATLMARVGVLLVPLYRGCFVVGAASQGVLKLLAQGPVPLDRIVAELCPEGDGEEGLEAWLDFGVHLGEFERGPGGYSLRGMLSRRLADARSDAVAALLEEVVTLHARLLLQTPALVRQGRRFTLDDQDGRLIARSSRMLEPFVFEAVDAAVPTVGPLRLLEIGCGSGTYIRRAVERNPALTALGVELQPAVAEAARANLRAWGVDANVTIDAADIRALTPDASFDLATLHNNIYYFPITARVELLKHVRGFLRAGGGLLLTTGCRGGSLLMEALNLWSATTEGCGSLPTPEELTGQLRAAGFTDVTARRLIPGEGYYSFTARRAASS